MASKELAQTLVKSLGLSLCFAVNARKEHSDLLHQYKCAVTLLFQLTEDPWEALQFVQNQGYAYHE